MEEVTSKQFQENRHFLEKINIFSTMAEGQKDSIASGMIVLKYEEGQYVVNIGDQADSYFIIKEGAVECVKDDGEVVR